MRITKSSRPTLAGPENWFTGLVFIDSIQSPGEQSNLSCSHVRFSPGARTAWHTHPHGQTLYVTDGIGRVGRRDGSIEKIGPGDVVIFEPGEEHWHGAAPDRFMAHVAIAEADDRGEVVSWLKHVSDVEYGG